MVPPETRHAELLDAFLRFHRAHPQVWQLFVRFTQDRIQRGFKHYSAYAICERIRWETDQAQVDASESFKINNNFRPFYARIFMLKYPECKGFFRVRTQTSHAAPPVGRAELTPAHFSYDEGTDEEPHNGNGHA